MAKNTKVMTISLPKKLAREVDRQAKRENMTRSEYLRNMIRRQTDFSLLDEFREKTAEAADKAGIKTLEDAVRIVREVRSEKRGND